jgi:perosamine synthetase
VIPLSRAFIGQEEIEGVAEVLSSGWLIHGKKTAEFERRFAAYIGVKHAVALNSCTSALQLAIQALGLRGEIIVPSFTFVASVNAIITAGCTPVFVDVEFSTRNIDAELIEEVITEKTVGIMPVHFGGQSCRMDRIIEIAERHGCAVIEDSAESIGAAYDGRKTGSFGVGCFSFFPTKNMTTGEGGMVTTNDDTLAARVRRLSGHGIQKGTMDRASQSFPWRREAVEPGYNYRLTDIQAAIAIPQLAKLDMMNGLRRKHAGYLTERLRSVGGVSVPVEAERCTHVYQMYTIVLAPQYDRDRFVSLLREGGVEASVHFDPPVHLQAYYRTQRFRSTSLANTEALSRSIVTLPMFPGLTEKDCDTVVAAVMDALSRVRNERTVSD